MVCKSQVNSSKLLQTPGATRLLLPAGLQHPQLLFLADAKRNCGETHVTQDRPKLSFCGLILFLARNIIFIINRQALVSGDIQRTHVLSYIYCPIHFGQYYHPAVVGFLSFGLQLPSTPHVHSFARN